MKIRQSFVTNSSSSSYVIVSLGEKEILVNGDTSMESCGWTSIDIDILIKELEEAKANGVTRLDIEHGGGYEG
jgi:hypothetical protein